MRSVGTPLAEFSVFMQYSLILSEPAEYDLCGAALSNQWIIFL